MIADAASTSLASFNPVTRPGYGSSAYLESGADLEDEYYDDEDEDWEIEEELAKLEQDYADEGVWVSSASRLYADRL